MSESEDKQKEKEKCRSCKGKGEYCHSSGGCMGESLYLPCQQCDGTGDHNQAKYIEARKQGIQAGIRNLTAAIERERQEVPKKIKELEDGLRRLEAHLEEQKRELAELESSVAD